MSEYKSSEQSSIKRIFITVVFVLGALLIVYKIMESKETSSANQAMEESNRASAMIAGADRAPTTNGLAAQYKDANNDLLADAPTDPKEIVDPAVIKFSYLGFDDPQKAVAAFKDLIDAIARETGKKVEYVEYASSEDRLNAFHRGDIQLVGLNTGSVPVAVCTSGFQPVAMMADSSGNATYKLLILSATSSPVKQLADIKGRSFAFTDMSSNSGYKAPFTVLNEAGLKFSFGYDPRFSQSYKLSLEGLKSGTYENIAVADDVLKRESTRGTISEKDYRVIYTSTQNFPTAAIGFRHDLSPVLAAKIRQTILNFKWDGTSLSRTFGSEGRSKFVPIDYAKDWEYVRKIDDGMGIKYLAPVGEPALYEASETAVPSTQASN